MNQKQLACVLLMMVIGLVTYFGQIVHKKVGAMKMSAELAESEASTAASARQTAEILTARTKAESQDLRKFLEGWIPHVDRIQTEQEVESVIELTLRERGITLVRSRKSEVKALRNSKFIPRAVLTTLVVEDEYSKVMNWMGDLEKRLPLARINACQITGGGGPRLVRLDLSMETPLIDFSEAGQGKAKRKT